ncbi:MAG: methyltransferase domain-containing protein [Hahellaceae bacterium]|nr:methyltransferase domain-containing protein [Hahellaceae bacterium]
MELNEGLSLVPDQESSTHDYASRFSGPTGEWLLEVQDEATRKSLADVSGCKVLEPGGAHGQNITVLKALGLPHQILSSVGCTRERIDSSLSQGAVALTEGDFATFPFPDRAFPVVLSYRMLAHIQDWQGYIREMCRVADRRVVVDYPTLRSFNFLTESLYHLKKGVESNTRPYRIFKEADLIAAFEANGFRQVSRVGQFFFPMAVHRALKKPKVSALLEKMARILGLQAIFGSPVIAAFERVKKA